LAVTPDAIWVGNTDGTLTEVDPRTRATTGTAIRVGKRPVGVAVEAGAVWVANNGSDTVTRVALH
jgi:DNA-binding beta-propeller fold protein YncE